MTSVALVCATPLWGDPGTSFFFFNDTATTEIYTLSLHDALPISIGDKINEPAGTDVHQPRRNPREKDFLDDAVSRIDRKSTRLNSSHGYISYAVFCLKKKKKRNTHYYRNLESQLAVHHDERSHTY